MYLADILQDLNKGLFIPQLLMKLAILPALKPNQIKSIQKTRNPSLFSQLLCMCLSFKVELHRTPLTLSFLATCRPIIFYMDFFWTKGQQILFQPGPLEGRPPLPGRHMESWAFVAGLLLNPLHSQAGTWFMWCPALLRQPQEFCLAAAAWVRCRSCVNAARPLLAVLDTLTHLKRPQIV